MKTKLFIIFFLMGLLAACDSGDQLAKVNGQTITEQQFAAYAKLRRLNIANEEQRNKALDQYLEREALAAVIEKQDVLDSEMIAAELNEFRKEMLVSRYFEKYLANTVTDDAVKNYYNTHVTDYSAKKTHVAHVLFRVNQTMGENERKAKLTAAQEAYSKIKAGQDFAEVAKKYSEDTVSGKKGGDLGWLTQGSIDKRFSEKIFAMSPGDVAEPFETSFGFHIVKILEGPLEVKQPFDNVKGQIRHQLRTEAKDAELKRLVEMAKIDKG